MCSKSITEGNTEAHRHLYSHVIGTRSQGARRPALDDLGRERGVIGTTLARIGALPYDSRERLASKEEQLAALGINWATDAPYDAELAQELERARLRRQTGVPTAIPAPAEVPGTRVSRNFRWSIGVVFIRLGRRLQGREPVRTAV